MAAVLLKPMLEPQEFFKGCTELIPQLQAVAEKNF